MVVRLPTYPLLRAPLLPERPADHLRRHPLAPTFDFEFGADLGRGGRQVGRPNSDPERRAHGAAPDDIDLAAAVVHWIAVTGKAAALELKSHQLSARALQLLHLEGVIAGEGRALVQLDDPAKSRLQRRNRIIDLVSI